MVTLPYPSWLQKADVNPQLDDEHSRSGPCWKTVFWQCRASHGGCLLGGVGSTLPSWGSGGTGWHRVGYSKGREVPTEGQAGSDTGQQVLLGNSSDFIIDPLIAH